MHTAKSTSQSEDFGQLEGTDFTDRHKLHFITIVSEKDPIQLEESVLELILFLFVLRLLAMRRVFCVTLLCWKRPVFW